MKGLKKLVLNIGDCKNLGIKSLNHLESLRINENLNDFDLNMSWNNKINDEAFTGLISAITDMNLKKLKLNFEDCDKLSNTSL